MSFHSKYYLKRCFSLTWCPRPKKIHLFLRKLLTKLTNKRVKQVIYKLSVCVDYNNGINIKGIVEIEFNTVTVHLSLSKKAVISNYDLALVSHRWRKHSKKVYITGLEFILRNEIQKYLAIAVSVVTSLIFLHPYMVIIEMW